MEEKVEKYFNEADIKQQFDLIEEQVLVDYIKNPTTRTDFITKKDEVWFFNGVTVSDEFLMIDNRASSDHIIVFERCYFQGAVYFDDVLFSKHITFKDCYFEGQVIFDGCKFQDLNIRECFFNSHLSFQSGKFNNVWFSQEAIKDIKVRNCSFREFVIGFWVGNNEYNNISIYSSNKSEGLIQIRGPKKIKKLSVGGTLGYDLIVEHIEIALLEFHNFTSTGSAKFIGVSAIENEEVTSFDLSHSKFDKVEFYRLDLESFSEVNIVDSDLTSATFINTIWPKEISAFSRSINERGDRKSINKEKKGDKFRNQQRETYRQLKHIMAQQGDRIQEQEFYVKEMNLLKGKKISLNNYFSGFWDVLILKLSSCFSNYGTNFGRALFWFLGLNYIVFAILIYTQNYGGISFSLDDYNSEAFWKAFKLYVRFLNPLHELESEISNKAFVLDFVGRIFSSYLIYHLIRTSRRFVSK